jgi:CheY-like chemotaxis protein
MLKGLRILFVDDRRDDAEMYTFALGQYRAVVTPVLSVTAALNAFDHTTVDVLVSDIGLPDQSGYDLIRQIRSRGAARGGDLPAIALTGWAQEADRAEALAAGFDEHCTKPCMPSELAETIARLAHHPGRPT